MGGTLITVLTSVDTEELLCIVCLLVFVFQNRSCINRIIIIVQYLQRLQTQKLRMHVFKKKKNV